MTLYDLAEKAGIKIDMLKLPSCKSVSATVNGAYFIALSTSLIKSRREEKVCLAHEIGHCETGSFYNPYSPFDMRSKHEYTANKWAIEKLIPEDEFKKACKECNNRWELSEYFDVTEDFMQKVIDYYLEK
ncbi:MAG: ImmA/IrrE family metallo-endopeptidase [Acutalibacteraceae bacterium]|jgi:Zn-dependent peptidase ImmA (M78 family)